MNKIKALITCGAIAFALSGCGASGGSPMTPSQANVSANVLQLAVGTANYAGTTSLNIVTTYRQPSGAEHPGDSGTLLNSPTLTLPAGLPAPAGAGAAYDSSSTVLTGPAAGELGTDSMTFTSQNPGCTPATTTFGQSGGVYGFGIEPFNAIAQADCTPPGSPSDTSLPFQVPPYPIPLYDALDAPTGNTDPNLLIPWGGPPAFKYAGSPDSIVGSADVPTGTSGVSMGIDVFETITPLAGGSYSLSVAVPANTGTVTQSKSFTLPAVTVLPLATNPTFVPDGTGGGTLAFTMPAGATEAYVELIDFGAPSSGAAPVYYTIETTSSGTLTLPDDIGPSGAASTSSGDQLVEQVLAFDYPAYESSYPNSSGNPSPTILGASGSDDLSLSAATCTLVGGASCTSSLPLLKRRMMQATHVRRN
jgi:hypothetical protein